MEGWSLPLALSVFAAAALADRTGMGEAIMGAVFLGAVTSLPGISASAVAAWEGAANLALSNAFGGVAAQTAFLAVADFTHRQANLEHAAASAENMIMAVSQIVLLSIILIAVAVPDWAIGHLHPLTPVLFVVYLALLRLIYKTRRKAMWMPRRTPETRAAEPEAEHLQSRVPLWRRWVALGMASALVIAAGWAVAHSGRFIALETGLDESLVGALGVAVVTSLPELVMTLAAVNRGALTLAAGGILGGNAFDTLFAGVADIAYREGPVYARASADDKLILGTAILMAGVLVLGLVYRQKKGPGGIGFESVAILGIYAAMFVLIAL